MRGEFGHLVLIALVLHGCAALPELSCEDRGSKAVSCSCERYSREGEWELALHACENAYQHAGLEDDAFSAATAGAELRRWSDVERIAWPLAQITGPGRARFHELLGRAAEGVGENERAVWHFGAAIHAADAGSSPHSVGRARIGIARRQVIAGDYASAELHLEAVRRLASDTDDSLLTYKVDGTELWRRRQLGRFDGNEALCQSLVERSRTLPPDEQVYARLQCARTYIEQDLPALARQPLLDAEELEQQRLKRPSMLATLSLNLAVVEWAGGDYERALERVERARSHGTSAVDHGLHRGVMLYALGRLEEASAALELAEAAHPGGQWAYVVPYWHGLVAKRQGLTHLAVEKFETSVARVLTLSRHAGKLAATALARHQAPFIELIGLRAKNGEWRAVLETVLELDVGISDGQLGNRTDGGSGAIWRALTPAPGGPRVLPQVEWVLRSWRGRHLIVVVPGGDRMWRLDIREGTVDGRDVGGADELARAAEAVYAASQDQVAAARQLGEALLPGTLRPAERVELFIVGPVAKAPLPALRHGSQLATARWRLARVFSLLPREPARHRVAGDVVVVGDPLARYPRSRESLQRLAQLGGARAVLGAMATVSSVVGSRARILQVQTHVGIDEDGSFLELSDGQLHATDIAGFHEPPQLAVIVACSSQVGTSELGIGAISRAFIEAGAEIVVATTRSITDSEAAGFSTAFYDADGAADPLEALARIQHGDAGGSRSDFAFEALLAPPLAVSERQPAEP